jgi:hypothetical protein
MKECGGSVGENKAEFYELGKKIHLWVMNHRAFFNGRE